MSVKPFLADPDFPQLGIVGDPERMREVFQEHLRPLGKAYSIRGCLLSRIRYRQGSRCFVQYTLRLAEPGTGREQSLRVTGLMYAQENRAERTWRKLRAADPGREIPESLLTFEPVSFIPDLKMLVQVFPYDRRLPTLPLLASPSPELEPLLLTRFGPGDWRIEAWDVEPVRYREQLGAVLRHAARARDAATGRKEEKRFYVKVYRDQQGERTYHVLEALQEMSDAGEGFSVGRPVAYLGHLHALVLEEAPGTPLEQILLRGRGTVEAMRKVARALAAFNQADVATTRRHSLPAQVAALERVRNLLQWSCPHLKAEVETIVGTVVAGLEEVPPAPTHRDLKTDHVFLDGDRTVFIDLDSFAGADPVLDPALLLARLAAAPGLLPLSRRRARTAARTFAEEYFAHVPTAWRDRLPLHYASAVLEVAPGFFRRQEPDWPNKIATLVEEAKDSLAGRVW